MGEKRHKWNDENGLDVITCVKCGAKGTMTANGYSPAVLNDKKEPWCRG